MGCDNLATKSDVKSAESNIINELNNKFKAVSIQISQGFSQVTSQISEVLNEIRRLKNALDEISKAINVIIPIVNNILGVVIGIKAEINLILKAIFNLTATINATLQAILNAIFNLNVTINNITNITNNIRNEVNNTTNEINNIRNEINNINNYFNNVNNNIQNINNSVSNVNNNIQNVNNNVSNINNNVQNVNNTTINNTSGGGGLININLNPILQLINNVQTDIRFIRNNCGGRNEQNDPLLSTQIQLQEIECIDCEAMSMDEESCSIEQTYEITPITLTGIPSAIVELDNKLVDIIKRDCEKEPVTEKFVRVIVTKEPTSSKVYYGETVQETVVFAGWVAFSKQVKNSNGSATTLKIGVEQPIRRMEQYFFMPEYADGYTVQPLHFAELEHELITVEDGRIIT
jgi:predicted  nucleic acid-binding Zn-ribbon protein